MFFYTHRPSEDLENENPEDEEELYPGQKRKQQTKLDSFATKPANSGSTRAPMFRQMTHVQDF